MELLLLVCAESAIIDSATNRVSLFNILDEFSAPAFPTIMPNFSLVGILTRKAREAQKAAVRLRITLDGQKQPLLDAALKIDFQRHLRSRVLTRMQGMPIPAPGLITVNLRSKKGELGTWNIRVNQIGQPTIKTQQASPKTTPARAPSGPAGKAKKRSEKK